MLGLGNCLDRYDAAEPEVARLVDDTHPAPAEHTEELVALDRRKRRTRARRQAARWAVRRQGRRTRHGEAAIVGRPHRLVHRELADESLGPPRESADVFLGRGRFTQWPPEQDFLVDQVDHGLGVIAERGIARQIILDRRAITSFPALILLVENRVQERSALRFRRPVGVDQTSLRSHRLFVAGLKTQRCSAFQARPGHARMLARASCATPRHCLPAPSRSRATIGRPAVDSRPPARPRKRAGR